MSWENWSQILQGTDIWDAQHPDIKPASATENLYIPCSVWFALIQGLIIAQADLGLTVLLGMTLRSWPFLLYFPSAGGVTTTDGWINGLVD